MIYRAEPLSQSGTEWLEACRRVSIDAGLVWKHYDHLERLETRYASQMERLRLLASTWFLATLAAVGFVLFQHPDSADSTLRLTSDQILGPKWVAFFILLFGTLGTLFLWFLDALVFRTLLAATFWEAIQLERMSECLIPVRQQLARLTRTFDQGVAGLVSYYYFAIMAVQLLAASFLLWLALRDSIVYYPRTVAVGILLGLTLVLLLLLRMQQKVFAKRNWTTFERRALSEG